jgi:hypothetical protein
MNFVAADISDIHGSLESELIDPGLRPGEEPEESSYAPSALDASRRFANVLLWIDTGPTQSAKVRRLRFATTYLANPRLSIRQLANLGQCSKSEVHRMRNELRSLLR